MSNNKASYPFYAHPMGYKRSIQIIKETKAEIKKMESRRPCTPFGRKKIETEYYFPGSSRPPSSSSLKSLKYEDDCLSARKSRQLSASKKKGSDFDLKLEPLVTRSVLLTRRNTNSYTKSQHPKDLVFPPIANEEKSNSKHVENATTEEMITQTLDNLLLLDSHNNVVSTDAHSDVNSEMYVPVDLSAFNVNQEDFEQDDLNTDELSQELKHILFVLDKNIKSGKRKCEDEQIAIVCKIYAILKEKNAFHSENYNRTPILKLLFKLLDTNFPSLSLYTIKVLLEMKIKEKNLANVFRLILKLINNNQVVNLDGYELTETLLSSINDISPENNKESILHGISILKTLLFRNKLEEENLIRSCHILLYHLTQFNQMLPSPEQRCDDTYININKEIFVTLHYLSDNDDVWKLISRENNLSEILKGLSVFYQNSDIVQIVVRLVSKIIDREDGCQALAQCPQDLVLKFPLILQTHKYNTDITLQTTFIIGNLILVGKSIVAALLNLHDLHNTLIEILEEYAKEHVQLKRTISYAFKLGEGDCTGNPNWQHVVFEVISQVLCIFANICLNPEAGHFLAQEDNVILQFLNIIGLYLKQDNLEDKYLCIYSFLVVIGNISYYLLTDSRTAVKIAKRVIPLLDDRFSLEIKKESANIIQNLTRSPEVRKYIQDYSLIPAFVRLLNEDDKEFNVSAYGIIMNLLLDKNNHEVFYQEKGMTKILHKLHLCTERDWKTSSILCQILWNYCKCLSKEDSIPMSHIEAKHLMKYLSYSTRKNEILADEESECYLTWKNDFCPVATQLLTLLQSKNSYVT